MGDRPGAGDRLAIDVDRKVRAYRAAHIAHAEAERRRERRYVERAAESDLHLSRRRALALDGDVGAAAGRQARIDRRLLIGHRCRSLQCQRRQERGLRPLHPYAAQRIARLQVRIGQSALDLRLGLQAALEIGAGRKAISQAERQARDVDGEIAVGRIDHAVQPHRAAAQPQRRRVDRHSRAHHPRLGRAGERDRNALVAAVELLQRDLDLLGRRLDASR